MKILASLLLPILIITMAVGGAFAMKSTNQLALIPVWYEQIEGVSATCTETDLTFTCPLQSGDECRLSFTDEGTPYNRVIHKDNTCNNPYYRAP